MTAISRRRLLANGAATLASAATQARAQPRVLNVFAHPVIKNVSNGTKGGDVTQDFVRQTGVPVTWTTFETGPLHDRLFREASLAESSVDVAFILNSYATPRIATLYEDLGPYMAKDPVDDIGDIFHGLLQAVTFDGHLAAVPMRHASTGLHYNEAIFAERGIGGPPQTIEDFVDIARRCTFTRSDGTRVIGFMLPDLAYPEVVAFARAWDADFITLDMKVVANQKPMVDAITVIRDLYKEGVVPRNLTAMTAEDANTYIETGRAAMGMNSMSRASLYNDPAKSQVAGKIKTTYFPVAKALVGKYPVAPTKVEFWSLVIPKNSRNKDLAWRFVQSWSSKENTVAAALNGNGPVRASAYDDPRIKQGLPYSEAERKVLEVSRVPLPAFDNAARAADMFKEEAEAAVLGIKTPQAAMDELTERVTKLIG